MSVREASRAWLGQRRSTYKCTYCHERYDRSKPNIPKCKTARA